MSHSDVLQLRQKIQDEYEAAERGLHGLASGTSRHAFITARIENISRYHDDLSMLIGRDAAIALIAETIWPPNGQVGLQG